MSVNLYWERAVRFLAAEDDAIHVGQPVDAELDIGLAYAEGKEIKVDSFASTSLLDLASSPTGKILTVKTLLPPLDKTEVPDVRCIGLNYRKHADEAGLSYPKHPILFIKGSHAVTGPGDVPVAKCCQGDMEAVDYESELAFVFGKTCKDVPESEALGMILGYASSNDVSARKWQGIGESGSQWTFSKGFDGSAPFGPCLVSTQRIPDPSKLTITGSRNGKVAQQSTVGDLIFPISKLISHMTQGTTIPAGTICMTGTPAGIGLTTDNLLKNGDTFDIHISGGCGTLKNRFVWE